MKKIMVLAVSITISTFHIHATQPEQGSDEWRAKVFTHIYKTNHWKSEESHSGPGSTRAATRVLRALLPGIIDALGIRTYLDAGCGDFNWMKEVDLGVDFYVGADIVDELIENNNLRYGTDNRCFLSLDITSDYLPHVDAIMCRDCLAHLSFADINRALRNFKRSGITYLIVSNYPYTVTNTDIRTGDFRVLNLQAAPFNFPQPLMVFQELSAEYSMKKARKQLSVWRLEDIKLAVD
jgi:methyltransferase family protein